MESQDNKQIEELDKVVGKFLKHYFHFFKLPEFVPRKWLKRYKRLLNSIYSLRLELQSHIQTKDAALEDLNINSWVAAIEDYITELGELLAQLTEIDDENKKAVLEKFDIEVSQLKDDLNSILENQESFPWYTGDGTSPVCFIDLTGCLNSVVEIGIAGQTQVSYTGGRVYAICPNQYTVKIYPMSGYVADRTLPPYVLNYTGSYSFDFDGSSFSFSLNLTEDYNGTTIYIGYNPDAQTYSATVATNISGATAFINNMAFTSTVIDLPCLAKFVLVDNDGYASGDEPTITGYSDGSIWYKSGDNWTFQDTFDTDYDGLTLTINYQATPLVYHTVTLSDSDNGYNVYINGRQTFSTQVESADEVEIICYLIDGYESSGLPTVAEGIDPSNVTRKGLIDEESGLQTGWSISFSASDMTGDVVIYLHSTATAVPTDEYRIYWNSDYLENVRLTFNTVEEG